MHFRRAQSLALASTAALTLSLAGCGGSSSTSSDGKITIQVVTAADYGYKTLVGKYEKAHPNIKVQLVQLDGGTLSTKLTTQLAAGRGAPDIVGMVNDNMPLYLKSSDKFADFADYGSETGQWLGWKAQAGSADGKTITGLGTDIGGMALCYRKDLFAKAGLPTDPAAVGKLWTSWDDLVTVGERFQSKVPGVKFVDSPGNVWTAMLGQMDETFFSAKGGSFDADQNALLKENFMTVAKLATAGVTNGVAPFTPEWHAVLKQGKAAVSVCPAWMLSRIQTDGGDAYKGKWSLAAAPGGGNWGGSYLMVPKQGEHVKEAVALAQWLTAPAQQEANFASGSYLPSTVEALNAPAVQNAKSSYFSDAPIGQIYAASALKLKGDFYRGGDDGTAQGPFLAALLRVVQGKQKPEAAWKQAISDTKAALQQ